MKNHAEHVRITAYFLLLTFGFFGLSVLLNNTSLFGKISKPEPVHAAQGTLNLTADSGIVRANSIVDGASVSYFVDPSGSDSRFAGNIGIGLAAGTAPSYDIQVSGNLYVSGSSRDYKMNITPLEIDTSKIYDLQAVSFDYKPEYHDKGKILGGGRQIGLIAEDVLEIIPELALSDGHEVRNVDYEKLPILLLVEVQKLHQEIEGLKKEIETLKSAIR